MNSKQRSYLRSLAMKIDSLVIIGKAGLTDAVSIEIATVLESHEIVKVTLLKNSECDVKDVAYALADNVNAEVVQTVGSKITLYKVSHKEGIKHIELPR